MVSKGKGKKVVTKVIYYLVKWKGYGNRSCEWLDESKMDMNGHKVRWFENKYPIKDTCNVLFECVFNSPEEYGVKDMKLVKSCKSVAELVYVSSAEDESDSDEIEYDTRVARFGEQKQRATNTRSRKQISTTKQEIYDKLKKDPKHKDTNEHKLWEIADKLFLQQLPPTRNRRALHRNN